MRAITRPAPDLARRPIPDSAVYRSAANSQFLTETSDHYPPVWKTLPKRFCVGLIYLSGNSAHRATSS